MFTASAQQMMFGDQEFSGMPTTIPELVHEIACCLGAYVTAGSAKR